MNSVAINTYDMAGVAEVYVALFGFIGALIGSIVGYFATMSAVARTEKAESQRWYSTFFIQKKIDRLADLQSALAACQFETQIYLNAPITPEGRNDLRLALKEFRKTLDVAAMYLSTAEWLVINSARADFERLAGMKYRNENLTSKDWDSFEASASKAMTLLQSLLKIDKEPKILDARARGQEKIKFSDLTYRRLEIVLVVLMVVVIVFSFAAAEFNIALPGGYPNFSNQAFMIFYPLGIVLAIGVVGMLISDITEVKLSRRLNDIEDKITKAVVV